MRHVVRYRKLSALGSIALGAGLLAFNLDSMWWMVWGALICAVGVGELFLPAIVVTKDEILVKGAFGITVKREPYMLEYLSVKRGRFFNRFMHQGKSLALVSRWRLDAEDLASLETYILTKAFS